MVNDRWHSNQAMGSLAIFTPVARPQKNSLTYFVRKGHVYGSGNSSRGGMRYPRQRSKAQAYAFRTMRWSADKRKFANSCCSASVSNPFWFCSNRAIWRFCRSTGICSYAVVNSWSTAQFCIANKADCNSTGASSTVGGKLPATLWATKFSTGWFVCCASRCKRLKSDVGSSTVMDCDSIMFRLYTKTGMV